MNTPAHYPTRRRLVRGLLLAATTAGILTAPATAADDLSFSSPSLEVRLSPGAPGLEALTVDGLGLGKHGANAIRPVTATAAAAADFTVRMTAVTGGKQAEYRRAGQPADSAPPWMIAVNAQHVRLVSQWNPAAPPAPLTFTFDTGRVQTTVLGILNKNGTVRLPALMHLPGQGSLRISSPGGNKPAIGYTAKRRGDLTTTFPAATAATPRVEYQLVVTAIYPEIPGIAGDHRYDSFRRNWLNTLQLNPGMRLLANNSGSSSCSFCYYEYADIAAKSPPLADGLTALDLVRQTLDTILGGSGAYGLKPKNLELSASDALPSLLIAAAECVRGGKSDDWLAANYAGIKNWADKMLATDKNGNGLVEYIISGNSGIWSNGAVKVRPSNWWDTIGFGHEDAYANALAYRALGSMEMMARHLGKADDATRYHAAAEKLHAAYFKAFYNPATGVIGGWRSADGELHDYYFLFVNGIAIHYGLVPPAKANAIMDVLMAKMKAVGYSQFHMGLPGNLITVALKDYVHRDPNGHHGGGVRDDNADGFQKYENGGATGCFVYFTLAALYDLGRSAEADKILFPMLEEYDRGGFEGRGANHKSNDWRMWDGTPMGYEGFLVDNYYTLLAVPLKLTHPHPAPE